MINYYGFINLERLRFAEVQENNVLNQMEGQKEFASKVLQPGKIFLVRIINHPNPYIFLILSVMDDHMIVSDKTEHQKLYNNIASYSKSFEESIYKIDSVLIESVCSITQPKEPDLLRIFKRFSKDFKTDIKERSEYIKDTQAKKHYPSYNSKKDVPEEVYVNRSDLAIQNYGLTDNKYVELNEKGYYHLTTLMYRLQHTKEPSAQLFYKELLSVHKEYIKEVDYLDYGFLDSELISHLTFSKFILEKYLFITFLSANKLFPLLLELYKYYHIEETNKDNLKDYIKVFNIISKKVEQTNEEKQVVKDFIVHKVDYYYIHLLEL